MNCREYSQLQQQTPRVVIHHKVQGKRVLLSVLDKVPRSCQVRSTTQAQQNEAIPIATATVGALWAGIIGEVWDGVHGLEI